MRHTTNSIELTKLKRNHSRFFSLKCHLHPKTGMLGRLEGSNYIFHYLCITSTMISSSNDESVESNILETKICLSYQQSIGLTGVVICAKIVFFRATGKNNLKNAKILNFEKRIFSQ